MKYSDEIEYREDERARFISVFKGKVCCTITTEWPGVFSFVNKKTELAFNAWLAAKADAKEQAKV